MTPSSTSTAPVGTKRKLRIVLALTGTYLVAEAVAGWLTGSLALLADAGHMLTDVAGLGLALLALWFSDRPPSPARTYGYYRAEILAALTNAVVLLGISGYILYEAYGRFRHPPPVASGAMLGVAGVGLLVNIVGLLILGKGSTSSLNTRSAYFEVLSDLLTSIGVVVAGVIMLTTGWYYADPLISAGIGLLILPRTWRIVREAVGVLLEGTPADVDLAKLREVVAQAPGVGSIHDLHVWSLTSGRNALSVHVVMADGASTGAVLSAVHQSVTGKFEIQHVTVQIEPPGWEASEIHV